MAEKTVLYEWLERWEQALDSPQPADLDDFVEQHCRGSDPALVAEFRRRADVLRSMAPLLKQPPAANTGTDSPASTEEGRRTGLGLRPGQEVVPGHPLERPLGSGGFGEVWQAGSPSGGSVALKFVRLGQGIDRVEQRALDLLRELRHPHFISVLGSWRTQGLLVIAMELAQGTLHDRLRQARQEGDPGIPRDELLRYFEQAADALDFLNRPGQRGEGQDQRAIQHRDIKPQNLLLVGETLKVGDFGLARCLENSVTSHTGSHTPAYAAPEFFEGRATSRSDQYSLAVTWCVLRGGRRPFVGVDAQVMAGHLQGDPDLSMLPEAERYPVLRAMSKNPKRRWPSCKEFVAALKKGVDVNEVRALLQADPMNPPLRRLYLSLRTPELQEQDRRSAHFPFRLRWNEWIGGLALMGFLTYLLLYQPEEVKGTYFPLLWGSMLAFMVGILLMRLHEGWNLRRKLKIALADLGPLGRPAFDVLHQSLAELRKTYLEGQGADPPEV